MQHATTATQGFSLLETLIATLLFGIVLVGISQHLLSVPKVNVQATNQQTATLNAKRYFEDVRATLQADFDTPAAALPAAPANCVAGSSVPTSVPPIMIGGVSRTAVRSVTLTCTMADREYTFGQDFGRRM